MIDPKDGLEGKKWLGQRERAIIKSFDPYMEGNRLLWALHHLDVQRKHYRLIDTLVIVRPFAAFGRDFEFIEYGGQFPRLEDKPKILKFSKNSAEPELNISPLIILDEPSMASDGKHVVEVLSEFAQLVSNIIEYFG